MKCCNDLVSSIIYKSGETKIFGSHAGLQNMATIAPISWLMKRWMKLVKGGENS